MSLSNATHTLDILDEKNGIAFCEITKDDAEKQSEYRFYVVSIDHNKRQVYSAIPSDCPESGQWFGRIGAGGVSYVANGRKRATARKWFNSLKK